MHALDLGYSPPGLMRKKKSTNHVRTGAAAIAGLVLLLIGYKVVRPSGSVPAKDARMPSLTVDPNIAAGKAQMPVAAQQQVIQPLPVKEQHHLEGMPHRTRHGRRSLSVEEEASGG